MFALDGIDPRSWTAADRASVAYLLLKRQYAGNSDALRELYELADDKDALAALDRGILGQPAQVAVPDVGVRHG